MTLSPEHLQFQQVGMHLNVYLPKWVLLSQQAWQSLNDFVKQNERFLTTQISSASSNHLVHNEIYRYLCQLILNGDAILVDRDDGK